MIRRRGTKNTAKRKKMMMNMVTNMVKKVVKEVKKSMERKIMVMKRKLYGHLPP